MNWKNRLFIPFTVHWFSLAKLMEMFAFINNELKHRYIIDSERLRIYFRGGFCLLEIDIGKSGVNERTFQFFTKKGIFNTFITDFSKEVK